MRHILSGVWIMFIKNMFCGLLVILSISGCTIKKAAIEKTAVRYGLIAEQFNLYQEYLFLPL